MANKAIGSQWARWDLHVHTPLSIRQEYGGDTEETWDKFIGELRALPESFKVIGVNDYFFIDGYKKLLQAKRAGQLPNIDLLLPVIELRLNQFAGTEGDWARVNYHVIFSEEIEPDTIEQQFIAALAAGYHLDAGLEKHQASWAGVLSRKGLIDLGNSIIAGMPAEKKKGKSPLEEGFNNLCVSLDSIKEVLGRPYFSGKHLTAIGKAEWSAMRWDQGAAEKKSLILGADMVFTAAESLEKYEVARKKLAVEKVNTKLLDCSDAHYFGDSAENNRIGQCLTWIKADTTFDGLAHAMIEYDARVYIGDSPPKVEHVRRNPTKFIQSAKISKKAGSSLKEAWFDQEIPFNTDLVAVVGRKGSGKSALADIVGLIGKSQRQKSFSFLNAEKFCDPKGGKKASHFEALLSWRDNSQSPLTSLDARIDENAVEAVKYVPQKLLEDICTELAKPEESLFDKELKAVIFSHVPDAEKEKLARLDDLVNQRAATIKEAKGLLFGQLHELNKQIIDLEAKGTPGYRQQIDGELAQKRQALTAHDATQPRGEPPPAQEAASSELQNAITETRQKVDTLGRELLRFGEERAALVVQREAFNRIKERANNLKTSYDSFLNLVDADCKTVGVNPRDLATLSVDLKSLEEKFADVVATIAKCESEANVAVETSTAARRKKAEAELLKLNEKLDAPAKAVQEFNQKREAWTAQRAEIVGKADKVGSIEYFEAVLAGIDKIPDQVASLCLKRQEISRKLFEKILSLSDVYKALYKPVQEFISTNSTVKDGVPLEFEVAIKDAGFKDKFFGYISQGATGTYCGKEQAERYVADQLNKADFSAVDSAIAFVEDIRKSLSEDRRQVTPRPVSLDTQLKTGQTKLDLYNFLYSFDFLKPRYTMRYSGRELGQLSPGERGTLLLVFYLLIDKRQDPLILDQPEENLDNETVVGVLVPCIKRAKEKRQIFIITHNANLAVVCDAEQVVIAKIDLTAGNRISYRSGAIEDPAIKKGLLDILEGTARAFGNRKSKYFLLGRPS